MDSDDKNANVKWVYGDFQIDTAPLNNVINIYLSNGIRPSEKLYYDDYYKGRIYYDAESTNKIIEDKRKDLEEQLERLAEFKYLVNKNSFSEKYKEYLFGLLKSGDNMFYKIMNKECVYFPRGTTFPLAIPLWDEIQVDCADYCGYTPTGVILCDHCKYYVDVIKEYKGLNN